MNHSSIEPVKALRAGLKLVQRHPLLLLGFTCLACALQGFGWRLFALGHRADNGVEALLLHGLGVSLYFGSLIWLINGLTKASLRLSAEQRSSWRRVVYWHDNHPWRLATCLFLTGLTAATMALAGFILGSLALQLLEAIRLPSLLNQQIVLSLLPYFFGLIGITVALLSQLFAPALVIEEGLTPSRAYNHGWRLLKWHWLGMVGLLPVMYTTILSPFLLLLLAEATTSVLGLKLGKGVPFLVFWLSIVTALPLFACTVTAAYRQISGTAFRAEAR